MSKLMGAAPRARGSNPTFSQAAPATQGGGSDELTFCRAKSNYAKPDTTTLRWADGTLRAAAPEHMTYGDKLDAQMRGGAAEQKFLDGLDALTGRG
jgi:hypothetical protein